MPTRTFLHEAEGEKRFWDISWEGGDVEISSGRWGTNGRARSRSFPSVETRDAFIAAEVRKVVAKGFVEVDTVAPAAQVDPAPIQRKVQAWSKRFLATTRDAWSPIFGPCEQPAGRVRGGLTLTADEPWPRCPSCDRAMSALLELDGTLVPDPTLRGVRLLQLLVCESWANDEPTSSDCILNGWRVRWHERVGARRNEGPSNQFPEALIAGWSHFLEVAPELEPQVRAEFDEEDPEVIEVLLREVNADDDGLPYRAWAAGTGRGARNVHKLGGWPTFVQPCALSFTRQVFQVEMSAPFHVNLGDLGAGHVLLTARDDVRFFWACH